jgi:hypothetical protein
LLAELSARGIIIHHSGIGDLDSETGKAQPR